VLEIAGRAVAAPEVAAPEVAGSSADIPAAAGAETARAPAGDVVVVVTATGVWKWQGAAAAGDEPVE